MQAVPPKEALLTNLALILETLQSVSGKKTIRGFTKPKLSVSYLSRLFSELESAIKADLEPVEGCEETASTLSDIARSFAFKDKIFSACFYIEKLEDTIIRTAGTNRTKPVTNLKDQGLEQVATFKSVAKDFESDFDAMEEKVTALQNAFETATRCLEQLYTKVSKKHDVAEIASVKWHTLCDQTVNELGFVVHFAKRIDEVAKLMLVYRTRPASLFQKRKASPSEVIVQWKEGPSSPNRRRKKSHEALANIPKPEVDHSMSHLIVYDRIAKLRKENEELRARIGESQIDLAYVKSLRDKNYEYTEELAQLQEEYERLQAQAESRGIRLK